MKKILVFSVGGYFLFLGHQFGTEKVKELPLRLI
jgi:hypothetical protein